MAFMKSINPKTEIIAALGEFVGTALFIFLGLGGIKTALATQTAAQTQTITAVALSNQAILFISTSMGLSLLVTAWLFYRITGGLFNPAVTLALWLVGAVSTFRTLTLVVAQIVGGIAGSALVAGLTPQAGISTAITTLQTDMSIAQGLFMEAFLTAALVFAVLMLAAEKHRATYLAPIGIGLTLFVCQLFGTLWTGCGMNPARAFGPSVVSGSFPSYHWIYWIGPLIGSLISVFIYTMLKAFDYGSVVLGQDSDDASKAPVPVYTRVSARFTARQRQGLLASGVKHEEIDKMEKGMVAHAPDTLPPAIADEAALTEPYHNGHAAPSGAVTEHTVGGTTATGLSPNATSHVTYSGASTPPSAIGSHAADGHRPTFVQRHTNRRHDTDVNALRTDVPAPPGATMHALGQETGGMAAPGSHATGVLGLLPGHQARTTTTM